MKKLISQTLFIFGSCMLLLLQANSSFAVEASSVASLQNEWARVNYQLKGKFQLNGYKELSEKAQQMLKLSPNNAEILAWSGIINSSYAGAKGGLGALGLVKQAKREFEQSIAINPSALHGSAYTSLGVLYAKVPGSPLAFGSKIKAKQLLEKGLALNPTGIDSNYFYADFLIERGEYQRAISHLEKAKHAPARKGRASADAGRKREVEKALKIARSKLK